MHETKEVLVFQQEIAMPRNELSDFRSVALGQSVKGPPVFRKKCLVERPVGGVSGDSKDRRNVEIFLRGGEQGPVLPVAAAGLTCAIGIALTRSPKLVSHTTRETPS